MSGLYSPLEITEKTEEIGVVKGKHSFRRTLVLGMLGGMFVAMGAAFSLNTMTGLEGLPFGIVKLLGGVTFCLGLILVILGGGELFTGNVLLVIALLQKKITLKEFFKNLSAVYLGNFIGAFLIVILLYFGKWHMYGGGNTAELILTFAAKKTHLGFAQALSLGILCNIYVCFAIWLCYSGKTTTDKIMATIFPISGFAAIGFEHIVANMFYLSYGFILKIYNPEFMLNNPVLAEKTTYMTVPNLIFHNVIPVTIGNFIGGSVFVAIIYWLLFCKYKKA